MEKLIFMDDGDVLSMPSVVRTIYDPQPVSTGYVAWRASSWSITTRRQG